MANLAMFSGDVTLRGNLKKHSHTIKQWLNTYHDDYLDYGLYIDDHTVKTLPSESLTLPVDMTLKWDIGADRMDFLFKSPADKTIAKLIAKDELSIEFDGIGYEPGNMILEHDIIQLYVESGQLLPSVNFEPIEFNDRNLILNGIEDGYFLEREGDKEFIEDQFNDYDLSEEDRKNIMDYIHEQGDAITEANLEAELEG